MEEFVDSSFNVDIDDLDKRERDSRKRKWVRITSYQSVFEMNKS
jgi:hypothetical protein